jgi:hypothetical protein
MVDSPYFGFAVPFWMHAQADAVALARQRGLKIDVQLGAVGTAIYCNGSYLGGLNGYCPLRFLALLSGRDVSFSCVRAGVKQ